MKILCRLIAPTWLVKEDPNIKTVLEGQFTKSEIIKYNARGYNIYWFPNHPTEYQNDGTVTGSHIDAFEYVFVDFDMKS
jgi:hypothetical protein